MATYFIGDVHGCYDNFRTILDNVNFDPKIDALYLTGDLVSRGPKSLEVLRWVRNPSNNAQTVLGNHDLHLLKAYFKINSKTYINHFHSILKAPDIDELIQWLLHQSILYINENKKILMCHAGIHPSWNIKQSQLYAQDIEHILTSNYPWLLFDKTIHLNCSKIINSNTNINKLQQIQNHLNIFTRMRYIYLNGHLDFSHKNSTKLIPKDIYPWFNLSKHIVPDYSVIFGHWATLQNNLLPLGFYGLDSGCCWGGKLTLLRWEDKKIVQIPCSPPA